MRNTILLFCGLLFAPCLSAQTHPDNDECAGAVPVPVANSGPGVWGSFAGATWSAGIPQGSCTLFDIYDVWYKFTAANPRQQVRVRAASLTAGYNAQIGVYSGTCGSLQPVPAACTEQFSSLSEGVVLSRLPLTGLTVGATYYIRVAYAYDFQPFRVGVYNEPVAPGCVTLLEPANGSSNLNYQMPLTFRWTSVPGAVKYLLTLTRSDGIANAYEVSDTVFQAATSLTGAYTWSVRAVTALDGETTGCGSFAFSTCAPATNPVTITSQGYPAFCPGSSVKLVASQWLPNLQWFYNGLPIPGATSDTLRADRAGAYNLRVVAPNGCYSNLTYDIQTSLLPQPAKPRVTAVGPADICNGANGVRLTAGGLYNAEWRRTGSSFSAWVDTLNTTQAGDYFVQIHATNGCNVNSDTFVVRSLYTPPAYSISASGNVLSVQAGYAYYQWYRDGAAIPGANSSEYTASEAGLYRVDLGNSATCKTSSGTLAFTSTAVATLQLEGASIAFFPNPVQDALRVNVLDARLRNPVLRIMDAAGRSIRMAVLKPGVNTFSLSTLPAGVYYAVLQDDRGNHSVRLLKVP